MDNITYNSAEKIDLLEIKAPYYNAINPTAVYFEQEKIYVTMDSLGHFEFLNEGKEILHSLDFPVSKDPSEYGHSAQYGEIRCVVVEKEIILYIPVYGWNDSYPYCDGESDRWQRYIARWFRIVFNCKTSEISVLDK